VQPEPEKPDGKARTCRKPEVGYGSRPAAYDLKKLRGKQMVERIGQTRHYQVTPAGPKAIAA
jgi:hypothetical protein